jgi:chromate transporter
MTPRLAWLFLRIGAVAFGGLGATVTMIERELVERHRLVTMADVTEALTYTKLLPGSTVVQVVAYLGWRLGGWAASAVATACFILPSALLMMILAYGYSSVARLPGIETTRRGVLAAVVALLLVTMYRLARPTLTSPAKQGVSLGAFLAVGFLHVSAVWVVIAAGVLGIVLLTRLR